MFRKILFCVRKNPVCYRRRLQAELLEDRCLPSGADLTAMSYNLFQGSELRQALTVPSLADLPQAVSAMEAEVAASDESIR